MPSSRILTRVLLILALAAWCFSALGKAPAAEPLFSRHVSAVFSKLGCNGGTCHGAVQGKNGFRLSLFAARPNEDYEQVVRGADGRRVNLLEPGQSLLLQKATAQTPHGGGRVLKLGGPEYQVLLRWLANGAALDSAAESRVVALRVSPAEQTLRPGEEFTISVEAEFADGSKENVTPWCAFESRSAGTATVDADGRVRALGVGDAAITVRFRDEPAMTMAVVARAAEQPFPEVAARNFIDEHVLAKLRRLNVPPSELCDDATFLRRARLDVTGQLPAPQEVREFLASEDPDKRSKKIEELLAEPGYAALWTLKFCDLLKASDYGVYADGLAEHFEAPRFQAWVRARLEENLPYDEFAARILLATSREGRSLEEWAQEVVELQEGYATPRQDLARYARRNTLDIYWQRKGAVGVSGALQAAHAFLGLRLECAQCHRHPHDIWQQDDLLSFANFFTRVRTVGFQGDNEKQFPAEAEAFKRFVAEGKELAKEVKELKEGRGKELAEAAKKAQPELNKLRGELSKLAAGSEEESAAREQIQKLEQVLAENEQLQQEIRHKERRGKLLEDDVAKRVLHAQILHRADEKGAKSFASVTSPLGTQTSREFRLLGMREPLSIEADQDPRERLVEWLRRPDNPYFAKAIVNRVWAHYFGRGLVDPPDDLSPFNPPTHPALLEELCRRFVEGKYDLKQLHRQILNSRTYQQSSLPTADNEMERANYAYFYLRRLPAEVLLDALNQATGSGENLDMKYYHWPEPLSMVELPYTPRNSFVAFMLEQFGKPQRNSSIQCDCERQADASLLQVLSFANHPRVRQKVADPAGRVAALLKESAAENERLAELYLAALGRPPAEAEAAACQAYLAESENPEQGYRGILWSLLNTKEFVLQH